MLRLWEKVRRWVTEQGEDASFLNFCPVDKLRYCSENPFDGQGIKVVDDPMPTEFSTAIGEEPEIGQSFLTPGGPIHGISFDTKTVRLEIITKDEGTRICCYTELSHSQFERFCSYLGDYGREFIAILRQHQGWFAKREPTSICPTPVIIVRPGEFLAIYQESGWIKGIMKAVVHAMPLLEGSGIPD